jgi:hypothetical protein
MRYHCVCTRDSCEAVALSRFQQGYGGESPSDRRTGRELLATILLPNSLARDRMEGYAPPSPYEIYRKIDDYSEGRGRGRTAVTRFLIEWRD